MKQTTCLLCICALAGPVLGQGTVLFNPGQFSGPTVTIDFETFPDGTPVPYTSGNLSNQWQSLGVLISDSDSAQAASAYAGTQGAIPHSGTRALGPTPQGIEGGSLSFSFRDPLTLSLAVVPQAGLWIQNGSSTPSLVTFYDRDNLPIRALSSVGTDFFAGLSYSDGIAAIRITDATFFLGDDLQFGPVTAVPEPGTWALLALGTAAGALFRRRCRHRAVCGMDRVP